MSAPRYRLNEVILLQGPRALIASALQSVIEVPVGYTWEILGVHIRLACDATVNDRSVYLHIMQSRASSLTLFSYLSPTAITAGQTTEVQWLDSDPVSGGFRRITLANMFLTAPMALRVTVSGAQAGDVVDNYWALLRCADVHF